MCRKILFLSILLMLSCFCFGQSADFVSEMIESTAVTYEDAAYFCAINLELIQDDVSPADAVKALDDAKFFSMPKDSKISITYEVLANMCMRTWDIKGGLMYTITKANRYAFKEMQYLGFIPNNANPKSTVSGIQMLNLITRCIEQSE